LAIRTGIAFEVWRDCDDDRVIPTAFELLQEEDNAASGKPHRRVLDSG
jgi:hypothetical protein